MLNGGDLFGDALTIPCLSLWQPWASLMAIGLKTHETRHWSTRVRGRVAIHAAKLLDREGAPDELCAYAWGDEWGAGLPRGAVVAVGELVDCLPSERLVGRVADCDARAGNFAPGRFGFRFQNVRALATPIPTLGRQGFFRWSPPADLEARLEPPRDPALIAHRWLTEGAR